MRRSAALIAVATAVCWPSIVSTPFSRRLVLPIPASSAVYVLRHALWCVCRSESQQEGIRWACSGKRR